LQPHPADDAAVDGGVHGVIALLVEAGGDAEAIEQCGNSVVWKPSEKTPLTALACQALFERVAAEFTDAPAH
ncbi:aldehyde dehydrogenase family protein, partial [Pseudomonas otitidis]